MRCIEALGEWSQLHSLSETYWDQVKIPTSCCCLRTVPVPY